MNDLVLLAALLDGPKHGYQLKKQTARIFGSSEMNNNVVYPLLHKFTAEGWVTKSSVPGARGQPRQQYALTATGRRELLARLAQFGPREADSGEAFLTRVGLFDVLDAAARARIVREREQVLARRDQHLAGLQAELDLGTYGVETVAFLRQTIANELDWLGRLQRLADAPENKAP